MKAGYQPGCWVATCFFSFAYLLTIAKADNCHRDTSSAFQLSRLEDGVLFPVSAIPDHLDFYSYATDNAYVILPELCVSLRGLSPNFAGTKPYATLYIAPLQQFASSRLDNCVKGWVVFVHGSGGLVKASLRYLRILAQLGYGVVALDGMAMPKMHGLRHRASAPLTSENPLLNDFWSDNALYESHECAWPSCMNCSGFSYCYKTSVANIVSQPELWKTYYERVYRMHELELEYLISNPPFLLKATSRKIFLMGHSEGAMVAARMNLKQANAFFSGRIISAWSCEYNYYVSCEFDALVCEDTCAKDVPLLNIIGTTDEYFSVSSSSVAQQVANGSPGHFERVITGDCFKAFTQQQFKHAYVVLLENAAHDSTKSHATSLHDIIGTFLDRPLSFPQSHVVASLCEKLSLQDDLSIGKFLCHRPKSAVVSSPKSNAMGNDKTVKLRRKRIRRSDHMFHEGDTL